jgi:DeoR/GlpR family transcriptional regulator of sugar metabolism
MLAIERRQAIASLIRKQSSVRLKDLSKRLEASASTIRRDLEHLEQQGVLKRIHGGAVSLEPTSTSAAMQTETPSPHEMRMGAAAANLVAEGETIFVGSGSIMLAVAHHIAQKRDITVVTNALNVATYLTTHSELPVILTGGQVDRSEGALVGHLAELTLRELRADRAIIGVKGIQIPDGLTGDSLPDVRLVRTVLDLMPEVIVMADSHKWGHVGPAFLAPLDAVDVIVTDLDAPPAMVWDLTELGIKTVQA